MAELCPDCGRSTIPTIDGCAAHQRNADAYGWVSECQTLTIDRLKAQLAAREADAEALRLALGDKLRMAEAELRKRDAVIEAAREYVHTLNAEAYPSLVKAIFALDQAASEAEAPAMGPQELIKRFALCHHDIQMHTCPKCRPVPASEAEPTCEHCGESRGCAENCVTRADEDPICGAALICDKPRGHDRGCHDFGRDPSPSAPVIPDSSVEMGERAIVAGSKWRLRLGSRDVLTVTGFSEESAWIKTGPTVHEERALWNPAAWHEHLEWVSDPEATESATKGAT